MNTKKKQGKDKEPIRLRKKPLANGNVSLYLDYYNGGKRQYEFLKLYLVPGNSLNAKAQNEKIWDLAEKIKYDKISELNHREHGFTLSNIKQKARFIDYLRNIAAEKKQAAGGDKGQWQAYNILIKHLIQYSGEQTTFEQVTKDFCSGFVSYLNTAKNRVYGPGVSDIYTSGLLSDNTKYIYVAFLKIALNKAVRDNILPNNPLLQLPQNELPKRQLDNRGYITIDSIKKLVATPCKNPLVKQAFLFSCFCGQRFSDVRKLTWGNFYLDNEGKTVVRFTQQKTGKIQNLELSEEALKFLPDKAGAGDKDKIFPLSNNGYTNKVLKSWVLEAGITERVTFHIARHSFATLLLSRGAPIETVSDMVGHASIRTTQIYAKIMSQNRRAAANLLNGLTD